MPLYDFKCCKCKKEFESIEKYEVNEVICKCGYIANRIFPKKPPKFDLIYNNATDMVDWDGNTSRYWDDYKKMKAEGKNPRIPKLDGDEK